MVLCFVIEQKEPNVVNELKKFEVVRRCVEICKHVIREKVLRVVFATLRVRARVSSFCCVALSLSIYVDVLLQNLATLPSASFVEEMIGHGLHKLCQTYAAKTPHTSIFLPLVRLLSRTTTTKKQDPDLAKDIQFVLDMLTKRIEVLR